MKYNSARSLLLLTAAFAIVVGPLQAHASHCSNVGQAGSWAYTYVGTIFTQGGPVPAASVGHFNHDAAGNITGSQTRCVAGQSGLEDISGTNSVSGDCTSSFTINVFVNGQLLRTAQLAAVYDTSGNHVRAIFQSLTLPDGTNVPVVITIDGNRVTSRQ